MTLCSKCRKRKAKRRCPALGSDLCPQCCGMLREKKLHCPADCAHFAKHKAYQEDRILHKKPAHSRPLLDDERMNWLALHMEASLAEIGRHDPTFSDRDAVLALEYAREKIDKGTGRILMAGASETPANKAGEAVLKSMDACRYQRLIILTGNLETYTREEKLHLLETVILNVKAESGGDAGSRRSVDHFIARLAKIRELAQKQKSFLTV